MSDVGSTPVRPEYIPSTYSSALFLPTIHSLFKPFESRHPGECETAFSLGQNQYPTRYYSIRIQLHTSGRECWSYLNLA